MFTGGLKTQGKFLVKLLSLALSLLNDTSKFNETLIKLAEAHCIRGVKAIEVIQFHFVHHTCYNIILKI
jgi:hypothetical protein